MPPAKRIQDDTPNLKEKLHSLQAANGRGRRNGAHNTTNGTNLKEVMSSTADNASTHSGQQDPSASSGMSWPTQEIPVLQGYRRAYRLDHPSSFKNPLSHVILGSGIGRYSPTMARPKSKRRVSKEQLALAVRKNFNASAVNETDVIVDMLYRVKNQDKEFRVHFAPQRR
ncbi:hypothetical protein EJ04DRAFT_439934 [Polyplosphaeria fusca]|uniref:Histone deacetylase complex subunit SAP30 Sin3 binding domain-containing protein n=1 Tax=Polyplosphaeria fusca TaxID=682080 RepID=A0A9P4QWV0_9PLEO|nr:hypothetical protein EJ04DRAFT_439934 [Polyplosphaeria fusca]